MFGEMLQSHPEKQDRFKCMDCLAEVVLTGDPANYSDQTRTQIERHLCTRCTFKRNNREVIL